MSKFNKFIIPLALVKIFLAFLVLQIFFGSCEKNDILYGSDLYTEGPLFEIQASLGNDIVQFESGSEANGIEKGDTLYLEIVMESNTLFDEISGTNVLMKSPLYSCQFVILDANGIPVFPEFIEESGGIGSTTEHLFNASFGYVESEDMLASLPRLMIGFVFDVAGAYTFHFINIPNDMNSSGGVDILYDRNSDDEENVKKAYAVYLFDLDSRSRDYGSSDDSFKSDVLLYADVDQAIIDFTVIEKN